MKMKKWIAGISTAVLALVLIVLSVYAYVQFRNNKISKVTIHIERNNKKGFVNRKEIAALIGVKKNIIGKTVKAVHTNKIERKINRNPYVQYADAFFDIQGNLFVNVKEKIPVIRITNYYGKSCYVDKNGNIFPLSNVFAKRVLIVNGYIKTPLITGKNINDSIYVKSELPSVFQLARKIQSNSFLKALISQVYVNSQKKIELFPEVGNQVIMFGGHIDAEQKLENLEAFYQQAMANGGWNKYKKINLVYTNQVICTKKYGYGK